MRPDVVIMAELDWHGLYAQSHVMAKGFAEEGHRVFYINRTLQRWPKLHHLMTRFKSTHAPKGSIPTVPQGITVINLWVGPPVTWMRWVNRWLLKKQLPKYNISKPVCLTYVPTYNCIDAFAILQPIHTSYICYHNFDADIVVKDLLKSEREIIKHANLLFADSIFLQKRIARLSGRSDVLPSPPGVHFDNFAAAYRGDEVQKLRKICFYGGAGAHLDMNTYNKLAEKYEVIFIAHVSPAVKNTMSSAITVTEPVPNAELPALLREMDVLTILYHRSDYIDGVIPAKFFECIATGKPVLVSGLQEALNYSDCIYDTGNDPGKAHEIIANLNLTHTSDRVNRQFETGRVADFSKRFSHVYQSVMNNLGDGSR